MSIKYDIRMLILKPFYLNNIRISEGSANGSEI